MNYAFGVHLLQKDILIIQKKTAEMFHRGGDCCGDCNSYPNCVEGECAIGDLCGVCNGLAIDSGTGDMDCNGECAVETPVSCEGINCGTAEYDNCGVCTLGTTGISFNQNIDCNGDCFGTASEDNCGECTGGSTGLDFNYLQDCAGVCNGDAIITIFYETNSSENIVILRGNILCY